MLVESNACGYMFPAATDTLDIALKSTALTWSSYRANLFSHGFDQAQSCFNNSPNNLPLDSNCNIYPKSSYKMQENKTIPNHCPFGIDTCLNRAQGTFRVDTGRLDSQRHFGINTRYEKDRLTVRKVMDCAPIQTSRFNQNQDFNDSSQSYIDFNYGRSVSDPGQPTFRLWSAYAWHAQQSYTVEYV